MSKKKSLLLVVALCVLALFVACEPSSPQMPSEETPNIETPKQGSLTVTFEKEGEAPVFAEDEIVSYELSGQGPEAVGFSGITSQGEDVAIDLCCGDWTIQAIGLNGDSQPVGDGTATVTILPDTMQSATIRVEQFQEEGLFVLQASWPSSVLQDPQVSLGLSKQGSDTSQDLVATVDAQQGKAECREALPVGYYTLCISLSDGPPDANNPVVVTRKQAFRIEPNNLTDVAFKGVWEAGRLQGECSVPAETNAPFRVSLFSRVGQVSEGKDVQFMVTADPAIDGTYAWYVDGNAVSETGDDLFIGSDLSLGYHTVDVIVSHENALASGAASLLVTEDVNGYLYFLMTSLDDPDDRYVLSYEFGPIGDLTSLGFSQVEGKGIPYASKVVSSSGNISGSMFRATDSPVTVQEEEDLDERSSVILLIPQEDVGDFEQVTQPGEDPTSMYAMLEFAFRGSSLTENLSRTYTIPSRISVTSYGDIGERIVGSFKVDSVEILVDEEGTENDLSLGNFTVEGSFSVERINNIYLYVLSFSSNGADSGSCSEDEDLPAGSKILIRGKDPANPLVKAGFTFGGWNTKADGSGVTYQEDDPFTMPNEDTTLYAVWK